jgi:hypothetical protein
VKDQLIASRTTTTSLVRQHSTQALGQLQEGPHLHCGPQVQAFCAAGCWQPQVQFGPGQVAQRQGFWFVSFMMSFLRCIADGMSSMTALSVRQHRFDSCLRRAALADAGTVPQVDRTVAASARVETNGVHRRLETRRLMPIKKSSLGALIPRKVPF